MDCQSPRDDGFEETQSSNDSTISQENRLITRDPLWYKDTGDCVILVDNVLFKIHKIMLCRGSSAFENILSIPCGPASIEGDSDENPVILHGDSPEEFRSLLCVLYALPYDLHVVSTSKERNLETLLTLCAIAHKYLFESVEKWAVEMVHQRAFSKRRNALSATELGRILDAAVACGHTATRDAVVKTWIAGLQKPSDIPPVSAIIAGDKHGIKELQGAGYYAQLGAMEPVLPIPGIFSPSDSMPAPSVRSPLAAVIPRLPPELTTQQTLRLFMGHWSLTKYWDYLQQNPPINHCYHCTTRWENACRLTRFIACPSWDIIGKVKVAEQSLKGVGSPNCREVQALEEFRQRLEARLATDVFAIRS